MDNGEQYPQLCHTYGASSFVDNIYPCTWTYLLHAFLRWQGIVPILLLDYSFIYFFLKIFHVRVTALLCYYSSGHFCWLFVQGVIHGQGIIISYRYLVTNVLLSCIGHVSQIQGIWVERSRGRAGDKSWGVNDKLFLLRGDHLVSSDSTSDLPTLRRAGLAW